MVWHRLSAHRMFEADMEDQSGGWSRLRQLLAVAKFIYTIYCGDGDFTFCKDNDS